MVKVKNLLIQTSYSFLLALIFVGTVMLAGCGEDEITGSESQVAEVDISPDSVTMAVGEQVDFSMVALSAPGDTIDNAGLDITWESTDTDVFTVENGGIAKAGSSGTAFCTVSITSRRFTGRDSSFVFVP